MLGREHMETMAFVDGWRNFREEEKAEISVRKALQLHRSPDEECGIPFAALRRIGGDGGEAHQPATET